MTQPPRPQPGEDATAWIQWLLDHQQPIPQGTWLISRPVRVGKD